MACLGCLLACSITPFILACPGACSARALPWLERWIIDRPHSTWRSPLLCRSQILLPVGYYTVPYRVIPILGITQGFVPGHSRLGRTRLAQAGRVMAAQAESRFCVPAGRVSWSPHNQRRSFSPVAPWATPSRLRKQSLIQRRSGCAGGRSPDPSPRWCPPASPPRSWFQPPLSSAMPSHRGCFSPGLRCPPYSRPAMTYHLFQCSIYPVILEMQ